MRESGEREQYGAISGKVIVRNHDSNLSLSMAATVATAATAFMT